MISGYDFYMVLAVMVPMYVAIILAYGSVRWWGIFTPDQCSGVNRFVSFFIVPLMSFNFISNNNPYTMNFRFLAADILQKLIILVGLAILSRLPSRWGAGVLRLDWSVTLFSMSTLPNTLVMGAPLLGAMYGKDYSRTLMVQIVVLQGIIWYTVLLFLYEVRAARMLITDKFPDCAVAIASVRVEPNVVSLEGNRTETEAEMAEDGRLHVTVRSSVSRRSQWLLPRLSNMTGQEVYSISSSQQHSPRGCSYNHDDYFTAPGSSFGSNMDEQFGSARSKPEATSSHGAKERHMFPWSLRRSPVSEVESLPVLSGSAGVNSGAREIHRALPADLSQNSPASKEQESKGMLTTAAEHGAFRFIHSKRVENAEAGEAGVDQLMKPVSGSTAEQRHKDADGAENGGYADMGPVRPHQMPPPSVMIRLILIMVWRKLIRNPNTYGSLLGLLWSLIARRCGIEFPLIVYESITILEKGALGMAMFSLGLSMALQPRIIECGYRATGFSMIVRFLVGPIVMAVASLAVGLRGNLLRIAIVQAALPQGIVPFVFAKQYNVHSTILSTAVTFGLVVCIPITVVYFIVLDSIK